MLISYYYILTVKTSVQDNVCVCVCVCMRACVCVHIFVCMYVHVRSVYVCMYVYICVCVCTYTCVCVHARVCLSCINSSIITTKIIISWVMYTFPNPQGFVPETILP